TTGFFPEVAITRMETGMTVSFPTTIRSNLSSIQPLPTKWPGSLYSSKCPTRYAPYGKTDLPCASERLTVQSTGSPTLVVFEEILSETTHCMTEPAGINCSALAASDKGRTIS